MQRFRATLFIASAALAVGTPAFAQADPYAPGTQVTDVNGGVVGTVSAVNGDVVTVRTDRLDAHLAKGSFTPHDGKLLFGMSQADLDATVEKEQAAAAASLQPGSTVKGSAGSEVGTIEEIDSDFVTLKLVSGKMVKIPRSGIAGSPNGAVIGMTAEDLEATAGGAN